VHSCFAFTDLLFTLSLYEKGDISEISGIKKVLLNSYVVRRQLDQDVFFAAELKLHLGHSAMLPPLLHISDISLCHHYVFVVAIAVLSDRYSILDLSTVLFVLRNCWLIVAVTTPI